MDRAGTPAPTTSSDPDPRASPDPRARPDSRAHPGPASAARDSRLGRLDRPPRPARGPGAGEGVGQSPGLAAGGPGRGRVSGQWVRVGGRTSEVAQAGTYKVKVPIKPTWRLHLDGQRVKAKLVVAATSPSGATVHTAVRFWLRG